MNYFAHGRRFVDDPFFLAGTALPDWMNVVDRSNRLRSKLAAGFTSHPDPVVARLAAGIVQHHTDDAWFHETRAFAELSLGFSRQIRLALPEDEGFRPHFLGHILVEILLDATLIATESEVLHRYYTAFDTIDTAALVAAFEQIAPRPSPNLGRFVGLFSQERFLWDYADDAKLMHRLNQVMRRVGLPTLPPEFALVLPNMRVAVTARQHELLEPTPKTLPGDSR